MARALGVASGDGRGWAMGMVRSAGLSCHPCLPLSWVKPCPQGLSPPSWPPGHISCQQEAAFPAPGPSHGPRPLPGHASRSLPDTCCPRSRSARRLPKDGRYVQFSPSLIPGDTRHASQVCAPLCGWRFKPACPSRRGVPRARSASFSPPLSSLLGTGPACGTRGRTDTHTGSWSRHREEIIQPETLRPYLRKEGEKQYSVRRVISGLDGQMRHPLSQTVPSWPPPSFPRRADLKPG